MKRRGINLFSPQSLTKDGSIEIDCRDDAMFDQTIPDTTDAPVTVTAPAALTLLPGTIILTALGERKVEDLRPGDRVITRDCGMSRISDVRHGDAAMPTVRIKADAFGPACPARDTALPADTVIQFRRARATGKPAGVIAAQTLVDPSDARHSNCITLCFDRRHVIYADGMELCARLA